MTSDIELWVAGLGRADSTRAKALQILTGVLEMARRDRAIVTNPAVDVKSPGTEPERIGKVLTDTEIAAVIAAAEEVDESLAGVVWLMARAGLRVGEALAIHRSDIDFAAGTITVQRSMARNGEITATKGRKRADQGRTIPMPPDLANRLKAHTSSDKMMSIDGLLFTGAHGAALSYGTA